ncbi:MAG: hypothetical protein GX325_00600 [Peptococcaceae bacterium]|nr:hypothetical protein [Peptococcaceae bacterium]
MCLQVRKEARRYFLQIYYRVPRITFVLLQNEIQVDWAKKGSRLKKSALINRISPTGLLTLYSC